MGQVLYPVPFETDVTDPESYSGARVARMILLSLGVASPLAVAQMYAHASGQNAAGENWPFWYVDPLGMQHALVDFDPRGGAFPAHWRIYTNPGQPAADNQLRYTLDVYKVAAATLVDGGKHWVCVVGYTFDDNTNALTGFIIHDPAYDGGGANIGVALAQWDAAYTQVSGGVQWLGQITEVGDPNPAEDALPVAVRTTVLPGESIIPPDQAARLAVEGALRQFGELPNLRSALDKGSVGRPRLVSRLDRRGGYYYLVPVLIETHSPGNVLAVIMVDAHFGDVLSVSASAEPYELWPVNEEDAVREIVTRSPIPRYESLDLAADRLADAVSCEGGDLRRLARAALGSFAHPRDHLILRANEIELSRAWAWHPCGGVSPFHPYHVVRTPWDNVYVNARSGAVRTHFDLCHWSPLGA